MSCPGDNYVVPGANPCSGGSLGPGVTTLTAGNGILLTGTAENPIVNANSIHFIGEPTVVPITSAYDNVNQILVLTQTSSNSYSGVWCVNLNFTLQLVPTDIDCTPTMTGATATTFNWRAIVNTLAVMKATQIISPRLGIGSGIFNYTLSGIVDFGPTPVPITFVCTLTSIVAYVSPPPFNCSMNLFKITI
jgi:hypothetical protein